MVPRVCVWLSEQLSLVFLSYFVVFWDVPKIREEAGRFCPFSSFVPKFGGVLLGFRLFCYCGSLLQRSTLASALDGSFLYTSPRLKKTGPLLHTPWPPLPSGLFRKPFPSRFFFSSWSKKGRINLTLFFPDPPPGCHDLDAFFVCPARRASVSFFFVESSHTPPLNPLNRIFSPQPPPKGSRSILWFLWQ